MQKSHTSVHPEIDAAKQLTIVASWTFSSIGQEECARFVADRGIDVEALFTHRWSLDHADEAYKLFDITGSRRLDRLERFLPQSACLLPRASGDVR